MLLIFKEVIKALSLMKKKVWLYLSVLILDSITDSFCYNIAIAFIMKDMLNAIIANDRDLFLRAMYLGAGSLAVGVILVPIFKYIWNKITAETIVEIKENIFDNLSKLPISYFEKHHSGEIITLVTHNVAKIENLYNNNLLMLIFAITHGSLAIGSMLLLDWKIAMIILPLGGVSILINKRFIKPIRNLSEKILAKFNLKNQQLTNILASIKISKMFDLDKELYDVYANKNADLSELTVKRAKIMGFMDAINYVYEKFRYVLIILIGIILVMRGITNIGVIIAMVSLQTYASYMFVNIGNFITDTQDSLVGVNKILELLNEPKEELNVEDWPIEIIDDRVALKIENLSFQYEENKKVLVDLNLTVKKGEKIALIGASGSGKSTISKLILNLYNIKDGNIFIHGNNIKDLNLRRLREMVSYVSQDAYLFNGTIEENIRCGNLNSTREEIIEAAKAAKAYDFIMEQLNQFETIVGEKAINLSGGQKQRLAIARALLKNAPILILDEATSSLDSKTEDEVKEALNKLMENKTVIIITHRLLLIENMDTIYVLDNGRIVEKGNHKQLISNNGVYKNMSALQAG
ncbi:ABC transporter ATP-binding protein [Alkaliphilus transvaalensis]|uniref:ABC transporter ATP-binding protein n=1 Tax=Alkaliphilus transvaalensis TaxID=114628 RepID=UPI00047C76E7|nr:ABC transporter ATP-binding protein [Alkaliphilus transvaalensis]